MKAWHSIACAGTFAMLLNGVALASCEPFGAYLPVDGRQFEFKDLNGDGKVSAGDKVVGRDMIFDDNGNEIGRGFFVVDLQEVDGDGIATKWADNQIFVFARGGLFGFNTFDGPKLDVRMLTSEAIKKQNIKGTTEIIGGTGDYAKASGMLEFTIKDGGATNHFNVTCR